MAGLNAMQQSVTRNANICGRHRRAAASQRQSCYRHPLHANASTASPERYAFGLRRHPGRSNENRRGSLRACFKL
jgi:hypothetical protein